MQYFEWNLPNDGKLWVHLKEDAKHLHDIGITSVWIPPAYKADEQQDEGYAVYDLYDLGEFDQKGTVRTKYGTRHELEEAVAALHENGISVYLDTVMNQKTGADYTEKFMACEVDPENREQVIGAPVEVEGWTGYSFPGRGDKYSPFKWHWYHFSGTDQVYETGKRAIYLIQGEGKKWSEGVDGENGNYDFLIFNDVDFDHPEVVEEMKRWGIWISQTLNADGMRLDALKHIKNAFIADFMHSVRASRGKEFYAVGEYWSGDFESLEAYLDAVDHQIDLFDAPLHFKLFTASQQGRDFDMRTLLDDTLVQKYPTLGRDVRGQPRLAARQFARIAGQIVVQTAGVRTDPADERGVSLRLLRRLLQHERRRVAPPPRPRYSARCPPLPRLRRTDGLFRPSQYGRLHPLGRRATSGFRPGTAPFQRRGRREGDVRRRSACQ